MIALAATVAACLMTAWLYARWARTFAADLLAEWWHEGFDRVFN